MREGGEGRAARAGDIVLPGELLELGGHQQQQPARLLLGPGVVRVGAAPLRARACRAGVLRASSGGAGASVDGGAGWGVRGAGARGECVVGVVAQAGGDAHRVELGGPALASLPALAFDGATKRNRTQLAAGDAVYARLVAAGPRADPELVCVDSAGRGGRLGVLPATPGAALLVPCSPALVRRLLQRPAGTAAGTAAGSSEPLVHTLRGWVGAELALGWNGRAWVRCGCVHDTLAVAGALLAAERASDRQLQPLCQQVSAALAALAVCR